MRRPGRNPIDGHGHTSIDGRKRGLGREPQPFARVVASEGWGGTDLPTRRSHVAPRRAAAGRGARRQVPAARSLAIQPPGRPVFHRPAGSRAASSSPDTSAASARPASLAAGRPVQRGRPYPWSVKASTYVAPLSHPLGGTLAQQALGRCDVEVRGLVLVVAHFVDDG